MRNLQKRGSRWGLFVIVWALFLSFGVSPLSANAETVAQEVIIYGLNSTYLEKISIPSNIPQSYQINVGSGQAVTYKVTKGYSVKVSDTGCITPAYTYWKRGSGYSYSVKEGEDYDYYTLDAGDSTVTATTGGVTYTFTVHLEDYSTIYCEQVMDAYIAANITDDMTDRQLVEAICRFPAGYDYSAYYSSARSMIINGGGDCWASTSAIIMLSEKLGIKAWSRNGNKDPGAGSGHMNAMVELNGNYYELEAGYNMAKGDDGYRPYSVSERTSLFSYYYSSQGVTVYQYDGYDTTGTLDIPETINGYTVIGISEKAFSGSDFTEITLPDTVVSIGDFAFSGCEKLTILSIPASVSSIGTGMFSDCTALTNITIADGNESYKAEDNVIYSKDGSVLVTCPAAANVTIPGTVTEIADYAFYYNTNLTKVTIPSSVITLGEAAFGNCSKLTSVSMKGGALTTIGNHCFRNNYVLPVIKIPASVTTIGAYAFSSCSKLSHIYFMGNTPVFGADIEGTYYDSVFDYCTVSAYYPVGNTTWTTDALTDHGGTVTWGTWTAGQAVSLENANIILEQTEYTYNKTHHKPATTVSLGDVILTENTDYVVSYSNHYNAGTATVTIVGIGNYEGEVTTTFTINKAELNAYAYVKSYKIIENDITEITYVSGEGGQTYSSSDESIAMVNDQGTITGMSVGEATITVQIPESENYYAATTTLTIWVTHDPNGQIVDNTVTDGTIQVHCTRCNKTYAATVPTRFTVYWGKEGSSYYVSSIAKQQAVGTKLACLASDSTNADLDEMEIISDNTEVAVIEDGSYVRFVKAGTVTITVRPKYNPSIGRTYTFMVTEGSEIGESGTTGDDEAGDNSGENSSETVEYYNSKTGITISVPVDGTKTATFVSLDESKAKGAVTIPNTIQVDGVTYSVTAIGANAFKGNTKLTSVKMGSKVKTIGANAFSGCSKLKSVTIGKNVTTIGDKAFYKCKKLTKITMGTKVTEIKASAFEGCTALKSVTVKSKKLKTIGKKAFKGCKNLKTISLKTTKLTKKSVGSNALKGTNKKLTIKVPEKSVKKYKTYFKNKGNKTVNVKKG
ncbi:MAG: leucine-rich repeat domain-containing protein [Lachnospiraceae bacterium]|nr:leucine-rich repeat domain-containing protein [Lachnospiraceae bacterium]